MVASGAMQVQIQGANYGALVLTRYILLANPQADLLIEINRNQAQSTEASLWESFFDSIAKDLKRREAAVLFDRKNQEIDRYLSQKDFGDLVLKPIKTQILAEHANEGLVDSVEFRRGLRKYIRALKNEKMRTAIFPEALFAETKTRKIIQHVAGSQIKCIFLDKSLLSPLIKDSKKQKICIITTEEKTFTHLRAEQLLQQKLDADCVEVIK